MRSRNSGITYELRQFPWSPFWYITWTEGSRSHRASTRERTREEAQVVLATFILEREAPEKKSREEMSLQQVFDDYMNEHGPTMANRKRAEISRKKIEGYFGNVFVSALTPTAIRGYISFREGKKSSTINRELSTLRAAIRHEVREGRLESAPHIVKLKEPPARDRYLTPQDAKKLYDALTKPNLKLFMDIALRTGARPGAIMDLKWSQVDFDSRIIRFHQEEATISIKRRATVPMSPYLYKALKAAPKGEFVVKGRTVLTKTFKEASERAKIKSVTPHIFRHTVATWLAQNGVDAWKISRLLGHSFGGTTERYMHHSPDHLRDVVKILDAQLARNEAKTTVINREKRYARQ